MMNTNARGAISKEIGNCYIKNGLVVDRRQIRKWTLVLSQS